MALSAGAIQGILDLEDRWSSKLENVANNTQRTVARMTSSVQGAGQGMQRSLGTALQGMDDQFNKSGLAMRQAGMYMTTGFTLPIVAGFGYAMKSALSFESTFAGVRKTVRGITDEAGNLNEVGRQFESAFRKMAEQMPSTVEEINKVAQAAGALGIKRDHILGFTATMIKLGEATNMTSDHAATALARMSNIMQTSATHGEQAFERLGSALVALGIDGASTEHEIMEMGLRIAGAGKSINLTEGEVLGLANALSSLGIRAEMGGTAMQKMLIKMSQSVSSGKGNLQDFANVTKMTAEQFQELFRRDPGEAVAKFVAGFSKIREEVGGDLIKTLTDFDVKEARLINTMLRMGNAGNLVAESMATGNRAFKEATELNRVYEQRIRTGTAQLEIFWNKVRNVAIEFGMALIPMMTEAIRVVQPLINGLMKLAQGFAALPQPVKTGIVVVAGLVAAFGPLLAVAGLAALSISSLLTVMGLFAPQAATVAVGATKATIAWAGFRGIFTWLGNTIPVLTLRLGAMNLMAGGVSGFLAKMATGFGLLSNPIGWVITAVGLLVGGLRLLTGSWDFLTRPMKAAWSLFSDIATIAKDVSISLGKWVYEKIVQVIGAIQDLASNNALIQGVGAAFSELGAIGRSAFGGLYDFIMERTARMRAEMIMVREFIRLAAMKPEMPNVGPPAGIMPSKLGASGGIDVTAYLDTQAKQLAKTYEELAKKTRESQQEQDKFNNAVKAMHDELSGNSSLYDASVMMAKMPSLHQMSEDAIRKVTKTLGEAVQVYARKGTVAPKALTDTFMAAMRLQTSFDAVNEAARAGIELGKHYAEQYEAAAKASDAAMRASLAMAVDLAREKTDMIMDLEADSLDKRLGLVELEFSRRKQDLDKLDPLYRQHFNDLTEMQQIKTHATILAYDREVNKLEYAAREAEKNYHRIANSASSTAEQISAAFVAMNEANAEAAGKTTLVFDSLAQGFERLANIAGESMGSVLRAIGGIVAGLAMAEKENIKWKGNAGIASALFAKDATSSQKWAAGIASAAAIAGGAMSIWKATAGDASTAMKGLNGAMAGAQAGAVFGPWGMAIGAVAGGVTGLVRGLFGMSQGKKELLAANAEIEKLKQGAIETYGSTEKLAEAARRVGMDFTGIWNNQNKAGLAYVQEQLKELERRTKALDDAISRFGIKLGQLGPAMRQTKVNEWAQELYDAYEALTLFGGVSSQNAVGAMADELNDFINQALRAGTTIPPGMQPIIEQLITMGRLTEENARLMLGLGEDTMPTLADIKAAADRYGLTLDELGPKVKQLRMREEAEQLVKDWDILRAAGGDVNVLFAKMGKGIQALVTEALKSGLALPESMKPMIQTLIDAGLLTDAAGKKLTDMGQLKFEESLTSKIGELILALKDFISTITTGVVPALDGIGRTRINPIRIPYYYEQEGRDPGIRDPNEDIDIVAPGNSFRGGTQGALRNFGSGTLAMLHGWERVQTEEEVKRAESKTPTVVQITHQHEWHVDGVLSENDFEETVNRRVVPLIDRAYENNVDGALTKLKEKVNG